MSTCRAGHWASENQLPWHREVTLAEDAPRLRDRQAVENLALVRQMALNPLRADPKPGSLKIKRKRPAWDDTYSDNLPAQPAQGV